MASQGVIFGTERALAMLRGLPRLSLANLKNSSKKSHPKRGRGQHGGDKHGSGNKGSGQRQNYMRVGYETGNNPFYLRFQYEPYYQGHQLQKFIDTSRLDASRPIDLASLVRTGLYFFDPQIKHFGVQLTDEGADTFKAKINIEVQWATEQVISAIERNGGTITTAYYDPHSLYPVKDPEAFFRKGLPIPKRLLPPPDAVEYYTNPATRGYLADPAKVCEERLILAQKYGYVLPKIEDDPDYEMLTIRKDPRQIFYGLEPGWVINMRDKLILKPKDENLLEYYAT